MFKFWRGTSFSLLLFRIFLFKTDFVQNTWPFLEMLNYRNRESRARYWISTAAGHSLLCQRSFLWILRTFSKQLTCATSTNNFLWSFASLLEESLSNFWCNILKKYQNLVAFWFHRIFFLEFIYIILKNKMYLLQENLI